MSKQIECIHAYRLVYLSHRIFEFNKYKYSICITCTCGGACVTIDVHVRESQRARAAASVTRHVRPSSHTFVSNNMTTLFYHIQPIWSKLDEN